MFKSDYQVHSVYQIKEKVVGEDGEEKEVLKEVREEVHYDYDGYEEFMEEEFAARKWVKYSDDSESGELAEKNKNGKLIFK